MVSPSQIHKHRFMPGLATNGGIYIKQNQMSDTCHCLPLKKTNLEVNIYDCIASMTLTQEFTNPEYVEVDEADEFDKLDQQEIQNIFESQAEFNNYKNSKTFKMGLGNKIKNKGHNMFSNIKSKIRNIKTKKEIGMRTKGVNKQFQLYKIIILGPIDGIEMQDPFGLRSSGFDIVHLNNYYNIQNYVTSWDNITADQHI